MASAWDFRHGVRDVDVFDVERADGEALPRRHKRDGDDLPPRLARKLCQEQVGGEGSGIDRHAEARPKVDQCAEVILMGVGNDNAGEVRALLLKVGDVGKDHVGAGRVLRLEGDAKIDREPGAVVGADRSRRGRGSCRSRRPRQGEGRRVRRRAGATPRLRSARRREEEVTGAHRLAHAVSAKEDQATVGVEGIEPAIERAVGKIDADRLADALRAG